MESAGVEVDVPKRDEMLSSVAKKSEERREGAFNPILVCSAMSSCAKVAFHADILTRTARDNFRTRSLYCFIQLFDGYPSRTPVLYIRSIPHRLEGRGLARPRYAGQWLRSPLDSCYKGSRQITMLSECVDAAIRSINETDSACVRSQID